MKKNTLKILLLSAALLVAGFLAQAQDKKISQLPALPNVTGGEYIPLAISGSNYYVTPNQLKSWLNIIGYVPLAGTSIGNYITGTLQYEPSASSTTGFVSTTQDYYFGAGDNKDLSSASQYGYIYIDGTQNGHNTVNLSSNWGAYSSNVSATVGQTRLDASDPAGQGIFYIESDKSLIGSTNPLFSGLYYDGSTASYVAANGNGASIFHRDYNDARYAPISGGAYLSSSLSNGTIYVGNSSNVGTSVTPSLNSSAGTFTMSNTGQFTFPDATNSTRGFLKSSDWTTFNNKQNALSGSGYVFQSGSTTTYTTSIPNASLSNSTISGVALGSNLFNHTAAYGLSGSAYNGSSAISWTADTTVLASKLYVTAKTGSFISNTVTTLISLSSVGTVTTGVWNSGITPAVGTTTSATTVTINTDTYNMYSVTSLSTATTFTVPTGTPKAGQQLIIRIKDNGTARALTFSTGTNGFRFSSYAAAPTTTTISKTMYLGFRWNEADSKWDNVAPFLDGF